MNIIELAKEADIYVAHLNKPMTDKEVRLAFLKRFATLVRAEALAETEITTPDVCGEVCARAKLCYGCGKALDEANAKLANHSGDANEMVAPEGYALISVDALKAWGKYDDVRNACLFPAEPVHQSWCNTVVSLSPNPGKCNCKVDHVEQSLTMVAEPVKQEPVAHYKDAPHTIYLQTGCDDPEDCECSFNEWGDTTWCADQIHDTDIPYIRADYAAPVDAKAIRAETLEEAAKFFEGKVGQADLRDITAAIRGLK